MKPWVLIIGMLLCAMQLKAQVVKADKINLPVVIKNEHPKKRSDNKKPKKPIVVKKEETQICDLGNFRIIMLKYFRDFNKQLNIKEIDTNKYYDHMFEFPLTKVKEGTKLFNSDFYKRFRYLKNKEIKFYLSNASYYSVMINKIDRLVLGNDVGACYLMAHDSVTFYRVLNNSKKFNDSLKLSSFCHGDTLLNRFKDKFVKFNDFRDIKIGDVIYGEGLYEFDIRKPVRLYFYNDKKEIKFLEEEALFDGGFKYNFKDHLVYVYDILDINERYRAFILMSAVIYGERQFIYIYPAFCIHDKKLNFITSIKYTLNNENYKFSSVKDMIEGHHLELYKLSTK